MRDVTSAMQTATITKENDIMNAKDAMRLALLSLATEDGINASGREELYGCTFGRDTAITVLQILAAHRYEEDTELLALCRRSLLSLCALAGTKRNIETGEEPGKFIHEFRRDRHEHLTAGHNWQLAPDGTMRNYDSLDATPLALIAIHRFWQFSGDEAFLAEALPAVETGLRWLADYADSNGDGFIDYAFHSERTHGGLVVQSWTDSVESMRRADGTFPAYPIAPVEAQGYAWLAWRLWADYYAERYPERAADCWERARELKRRFNEAFIFEDEYGLFAAQAIDGEGKAVSTVTVNPALALWAHDEKGGIVESIFEDAAVPGIVQRLFAPDMFEAGAGIRTMSASSVTFNPNADSYHNGSFWPMANGLAYLGFLAHGYGVEAAEVRRASLEALEHYQVPIELYLKNPGAGYSDYAHACKVQAWSAGAYLAMLVSGHLAPQELSTSSCEPLPDHLPAGADNG